MMMMPNRIREILGKLCSSTVLIYAKSLVTVNENDVDDDVDHVIESDGCSITVQKSF